MIFQTLKEWIESNKNDKVNCDECDGDWEVYCDCNCPHCDFMEECHGCIDGKVRISKINNADKDGRVRKLYFDDVASIINNYCAWSGKSFLLEVGFFVKGFRV